MHVYLRETEKEREREGEKEKEREKEKEKERGREKARKEVQDSRRERKWTSMMRCYWACCNVTQAFGPYSTVCVRASESVFVGMCECLTH